jgi:NADH-quinone oxidoreductase subunit G
VNEEWLSDKARFRLDGLRRQRLDTADVARERALRRLLGEALASRRRRCGPAARGSWVTRASVEAAFASRTSMARVGGTVECRTDGARLIGSGARRLCRQRADRGRRGPSASSSWGRTPAEAPVLNAASAARG